MTNSHSSSQSLTERGRERECVCVYKWGFMVYMFYLSVVQDMIRELSAKATYIIDCYKPITMTGEGR